MNQLLFVVISSIFKLLALMPLKIIGPIARFLGWVLWQTNSKARRITQENLRICFPEKSETERCQIAKQRMIHLSMTALELGAAWCWSTEKLLEHLLLSAGNTLLDESVVKGKGVILLVPHHGNWEILGAYVGFRHKLVCLYQPPKIKAVDKIVNESRSRFCSELAPTNIKGVKILLKALKRGDVVGILPDQVPPTGSGEYSHFFGTPALTMTLVYNLIQRTGASVVVGYAKRINSTKYFQPIFRELPQGINSSDLHESLQALNTCVEQIVLECPEQYQWEYKRFKKQPDGLKRYK